MTQEEKFKKVTTDIIEAIDKLDYNDKEMELMKVQIEYILYLMTKDLDTYNNDLKILDMRLRK